MNWLKNTKTFTMVMLLCSTLLAAGLTSCKKSEATGEEATSEHPAMDSTEHAEHPQSDSEHPQGESEHPNNDTTGN